MIHMKRMEQPRQGRKPVEAAHPDPAEIATLIDRFMAAETTLDEEQQLYDYFARPDVAPELEPYRTMFAGYAALATVPVSLPKEVRPEAKPHRGIMYSLSVRRWWIGVAASVALLVATVAGVWLHGSEMFYRYHRGSYMIVEGRCIDDPWILRRHVRRVLADAEVIEYEAARDVSIESIEQDVLDMIPDATERERLRLLLQ